MDSLPAVSIYFRWVTKYISEEKPGSLAGNYHSGGRGIRIGYMVPGNAKNYKTRIYVKSRGSGTCRFQVSVLRF